MKDIVWVCHFYPFPSTGHGALQRTHHLVKSVAQHHRVHVIAIGGDTARERDVLEMGVASVTKVALPSRLDKALAVARSLASELTYWEALFVSSALRQAVARAVAREPSVLLLDTVFLAPLLDLVGKTPVVINHHNVESDVLVQRASRASRATQRAFFGAQATKTFAREQEASTRAHTNVLVSAEDGARFAVVAPDARIAVVANGVDVNFFVAPAGIARVPYSLVFAGGMDWFPNAHAVKWLCEEIWPAIAQAEPRRTLTIIGRNPPPEAAALASRDPRVRVVGFVDDVRPHIAGAHAYLCPITVGGGTRLKVLDALAMRCPLVATGLSVEGLDLRDRQHYLKAESISQMAAALATLDENPELVFELQQNGRRHVEDRFAWSVVAESLLRVLN